MINLLTGTEQSSEPFLSVKHKLSDEEATNGKKLEFTKQIQEKSSSPSCSNASSPRKRNLKIIIRNKDSVIKQQRSKIRKLQVQNKRLKKKVIEENDKQNVDLEASSDKYSIKNLLFYRTIPVYTAPEVPAGNKLYNCTDCGDRFVFESSYNQHINRKSMKITYKCRHCSVLQRKVYFNRCNLLSHIRSHTFKTATINVSDLKIEPLPLSYYKKIENVSHQKVQSVVPRPALTCNECNDIITGAGPINKDRAEHYMKFVVGSEVQSCPICLFTLPTMCALMAHIRIHLKVHPLLCPECGYLLSNKMVLYPYNHKCEGFKMMRATARLKCSITKCNLFHPNDFKEHMRKEHLKKVFKCPQCVVACFSEATITKHLTTHQNLTQIPINSILIFYQCEMCPGRLVLHSHLESHLNSHINTHVYPCWACGAILDNETDLIHHHIDNHQPNESIKNIYYQSLPGNQSKKKNMNHQSLPSNEANNKNINQQSLPVNEPKTNYRVVKRCDQCLRSFTYKCTYEEINVLPNICPYKCTSSTKTVEEASNVSNSQIICTLCNNKLNQEWQEIKTHYAMHHKNHKCVDVKISLPKLNIKKYTSKKQNIIKKSRKNRKARKSASTTSNVIQQVIVTANSAVESNFICTLCKDVFDTKENLEIHIKHHRDPCMAYQCLECGRSFVVKPSFTTHLLLEHGISDVDTYIVEKQCYNDNALIIQQLDDADNHNVPLEENQCKICRERYDNLDDLEKHFRVHGMAFLIKNSQTKPTP